MFPAPADNEVAPSNRVPPKGTQAQFDGAPLFTTPPAHPCAGMGCAHCGRAVLREGVCLRCLLGHSFPIRVASVPQSSHPTRPALGAPSAPFASSLGGALYCASPPHVAGKIPSSPARKNNPHRIKPAAAPNGANAPRCAGSPLVTPPGEAPPKRRPPVPVKKPPRPFAPPARPLRGQAGQKIYFPIPAALSVCLDQRQQRRAANWPPFFSYSYDKRFHPPRLRRVAAEIKIFSGFFLNW